MIAAAHETFHSFTPAHGVVVLIAAPLMFALCRLGMAWKGTQRERTFRHAISGSNLIVQLFSGVWYLLPRNFDWHTSLPLQLCDIAGWFALFAMWSEKRWIRTITFFWGFGLCTQAFITPTLRTGPETVKFWLFFLTHFEIILAAAYVTVVLNYRPAFRDWAFACGAMFVIGMPIVGLDAVTDFNYFFAGRSTPGAPTIIDKLGPYPRRLPLIFICACAAMFLVLVISRILMRNDRRNA